MEGNAQGRVKMMRLLLGAAVLAVATTGSAQRAVADGTCHTQAHGFHGDGAGAECWATRPDAVWQGEMSAWSRPTPDQLPSGPYPAPTTPNKSPPDSSLE